MMCEGEKHPEPITHKKIMPGRVPPQHPYRAFLGW